MARGVFRTVAGANSDPRGLDGRKSRVVTDALPGDMILGHAPQYTKLSRILVIVTPIHFRAGPTVRKTKNPAPGPPDGRGLFAVLPLACCDVFLYAHGRKHVLVCATADAERLSFGQRTFICQSRTSVSPR